MEISVIIPSYKPQEYIWECLNSLNQQTIGKDCFEIVLVLNGCNEPYNSQILNWIKEHKELQINYRQTDTLGVSNARNIALSLSRGEYVTFIDDDDFVSPTYLEELYKNVSKTVVSLCYPLAFKDGTMDFAPFRITGDYMRNKGKGLVSFTQARKYFSGPVYKLIHKSILRDIKFDTRLRNGEDTLFMFSISDKLNKVSFTSEKAVYYRRFRENSAYTRKKTFKEKLKNNSIQIGAYFSFFLKKPFSYNLYFFISRVGGAILATFK